MRSLRPRVSPEQALRRLRLPGPRRRSALAASELPHLELVGLPYYRVDVEASGWGGERRATYLVDAVSGGAAQLVGDHEWHEGPIGISLESRLGPHEAEAETRALFERGALLAKWARLRLLAVGTPGLVAYPYWVGYYERREGLLDVRVLDALSGRPAGAAVRRSLLEAFVSMARARPAEAVS